MNNNFRNYLFPCNYFHENVSEIQKIGTLERLYGLDNRGPTFKNHSLGIPTRDGMWLYKKYTSTKHEIRNDNDIDPNHKHVQVDPWISRSTFGVYGTDMDKKIDTLNLFGHDGIKRKIGNNTYIGMK